MNVADIDLDVAQARKYGPPPPLSASTYKLREVAALRWSFFMQVAELRFI